MANNYKYMIMDAARMDGFIFQAKELNELHTCLFSGDSEAVLGHIAPWLFELESGVTPFNEWLIGQGAADNWGVLVQSDLPIEDVANHLRQFLMVDQEDGTELLFRFYDPRVLRVFLPACIAGELIEFFGPVSTYVMEDENGNMLRFELNGNELIQTDLNMDLEAYLLSPAGEVINTEPTTSPDPTISEGKEERWDF